MKFIKGKYEKALRQHENIKNYKWNAGEKIYYLQDMGDFTYGIYTAKYDEDEFICECVASIDQNKYKTITAMEIKNLIKSKQ